MTLLILGVVIYFIFDWLNYILDCTSLPPTLKNMNPLTTPVTYGSVVTLSCVTGHSNRGDAEITCLGGENFSWNTTPICEIGKTKYSL